MAFIQSIRIYFHIFFLVQIVFYSIFLLLLFHHFNIHRCWNIFWRMMSSETSLSLVLRIGLKLLQSEEFFSQNQSPPLWRLISSCIRLISSCMKTFLLLFEDYTVISSCLKTNFILAEDQSRPAWRHISSWLRTNLILPEDLSHPGWWLISFKLKNNLFLSEQWLHHAGKLSISVWRRISSILMT